MTDEKNYSNRLFINTLRVGNINEQIFNTHYHLYQLFQRLVNDLESVFFSELEKIKQSAL